MSENPPYRTDLINAAMGAAIKRLASSSCLGLNICHAKIAQVEIFMVVGASR